MEEAETEAAADATSTAEAVEAATVVAAAVVLAVAVEAVELLPEREIDLLPTWSESKRQERRESVWTTHRARGSQRQKGEGEGRSHHRWCCSLRVRAEE